MIKTTTNKTKIADYLNCKWEAGANGPDKYDCHHLVIEIKKKFYNQQLPSVEVNANNLFSVIKAIKKNKVWNDFVKLDKPEDGCIVKMFSAEQPNHIGIYIKMDSGGVLHCSQRWNVSFDSVFNLRKVFSNIEFWKYIGN